ncbi:TetR family transcriptional regulator [Vibrio parahaemolyticus]|uniref:TetR family transcriptional regulator n=13 Tax=Vibrionaceae TaxID=641 RepID=A0A7H5CRJ0_VIBPH|nr:TetR family transcriptional regulator [Vibrio parahaemolyticus]KJQ88476.1 TetR family transcriptional regulator [Vibrio sp. S512-13]KJQ89284.1 TetR family transcriptional regulator [Vibrio sp. S457-15]OOI02095.1 TetR family transcriptional regulator [Vibrio sp. OULL4]OOI10634.1 TetR family transcriptional regulator [Vibrio sp. SALL6]OQK11001.1 TetR family transcriptional regulator [Vibrio parahaemolyticus O4:K55 str. NY3547]OQS99676.1 TetR family transcriptional regulator [Vibrio parahaemo
MNERSFTGSRIMTDNPAVDKRDQILAAAEQLIAESGFQGLSMQKLANEAGVAAGTIYRYFSDKEHLLEEVRLNVAKRIASAVQAGVNDDMPLKERYRTMWLNIWNLAGSNLNAISNRVQYDSLPCTTRNKTWELERKMFAQVDRLFNQGKEEGVFKPLDNEVLSGLSFEASVALARKHALGFYQLDDDALEAAIEASWDAIIKH